jgi:hypothetical protein
MPQDREALFRLAEAWIKVAQEVAQEALSTREVPSRRVKTWAAVFPPDRNRPARRRSAGPTRMRDRHAAR